MITTRPSLLKRVKNRADQRAWDEFFRLYWPLLVGFARSRGLERADAEDVAQDCMNKLAQALRSFDYNRDKGTFKNYLYTLISRQISNKMRARKLKQARTAQLLALRADEDKSDWEHQWLRRHFQFGLEAVEGEFSELTIACFKLHTIQGWPVSKITETLSVTANQVYLAKSRVTARLRAKMAELIGFEI